MYHLTDDEYQAEIEISPFFKQHSFILDPELEERIKEEGTQLIDLTPVDTALEAIARLPPAGAPIIRSWSAADTALCIFTIVGYVVTLTLAFLLHKRVNAVQESFNKCTSRAFSDVIKPTKNPNLRTQPTCLRSRLYRLVEPLTIKPIRMTNNPKECTLTSSQVPNLFLPKLPCTRIQSMMEMLFVSCVCLFSLPLVPVPADVHNGNLTEQRGMCRTSLNKDQTIIEYCIPKRKLR